MHQQILGHLLGVLDEDEDESVDARVERDEAFRRELLGWRRRLAPLEAMRPDFEPPSGLAERACRFVRAYAAATDSQEPGRCMSPLPVPPGCAGRVGWLDVGMVALLLVGAVAVLLPAISASRFETRLGICQDGLRQVGLALSQYGHDQRNTLGQLASNGRLTRAGVRAAELLREGYFGDGHRNLCPDAWLAAQGVLCEFSRIKDLPEGLRPQTVSNIDDHYDDWPGMLRNGTTGDRRLPPLPAATPLLADAPSADLPGQSPSSHDGLGKNVYFDDGRVDFLPASASADAAGWRLSEVQDSPAPRISVPIVLVSGRLR